jgi:hypothetical protein
MKELFFKQRVIEWKRVTSLSLLFSQRSLQIVKKYGTFPSVIMLLRYWVTICWLSEASTKLLAVCYLQKTMQYHRLISRPDLSIYEQLSGLTRSNRSLKKQNKLSNTFIILVQSNTWTTLSGVPGWMDSSFRTAAYFVDFQSVSEALRSEITDLTSKR